MWAPTIQYPIKFQPVFLLLPICEQRSFIKLGKKLFPTYLFFSLTVKLNMHYKAYILKIVKKKQRGSSICRCNWAYKCNNTMESVRLVVNRCAKLWNTKLENCTREKRQIQGGTHVKWEAYLWRPRFLSLRLHLFIIQKETNSLKLIRNVLV